MERLSDTKNIIVVYFGEDTKEKKTDKLVKYLKENNFKLKLTGPNGFGYCPWTFINLDNKIIVLGKPGVKFAEPYIKHAVLVDEFINVNESYKKYKTLYNHIVNEISEKYKNLKFLYFDTNKKS